MKTLTTTKRTTRRLAASIAILTALATSGAWARESVNWQGGSGGTEESPLDIYDTSKYSSSVTELGDNYNLTFDTQQTPTVLTNSAPTGTKIANLFSLKYGTWTMLGDYKFSTIDTTASGTDPKQTTIIKKGDWETTYATYLGRSGMTAILTNVCGNIVHSGNTWFSIGHENTGTAIVENLSGDWNIAGPFTVGNNGRCELYWRGGNLTYTYTGSILYLANGATSSVLVDKYAGDWNIAGPFHVGKNGRCELYWRGGNLTYTYTEKPLYLAYGGSSNALVEKYDGDWTISHYLCLSEGGSSSATFRHLGGTMKVNGTDIRLLDNKNNSTGGANFELGGGTVEAKLVKHGLGSAPATLKFNGGTLKALAAGTLVENSNYLVVSATANGGTIDANGYAVTVEEAIENASGETGKMTFVGGGMVTLAAQPTYTGVTTVEVGTTLVVPSAITGDKLAFTIPDGLADGVYTVVSISGNFQFADDVLSGKAEGFVLSTDKKKICYVKNTDTTKPIYIGTDGNLSAAGNWLDGTVPTGGTGDAQIFCTSAATLTVGDTFAPSTITVPDASAVVTLGAGALHVNTLTNASKLAIGAGASLEVDGDIVAKPSGYGKTAYFLDSNEGSVIVHGNAVGIGVSSVNVYEYATGGANTMPMQVGGIRYEAGGNTLYFHINSANSYYNQGPGSWVIGGNGIGFTSGREHAVTHFFTQYGGSVMFHSSADWTLANSMKNNANQGDMLVNVSGDITFDTSDYSDPTVSRTVTLEGRLYANNVGMGHSAFIIDGCGTVVVDTADMSGVTGIDESLKHTCISNSILQVKSGATLKVNAGKKITGANGRITLDAGATLALAANSKDFTPCVEPSLTLPETGTATIRIDGARLKSGDQVIATIASGTTANVTLDPASTALDDRKGTLRVEDGNLILNIQPTGLMIIFR